MKQTTSIILLALIFNLIFPKISQAATTNIYAEAVYASGSQTYQPERALGEPDGVNTDFFKEDTYITLDLGEDNQSTGDLTLYFELQSLGSSYQVDFFDNEMNEIKTTSDEIPLSVSELTVDYTETTAYRYVKITCVENETWSLDAIMTIKNIADEEETVEKELVEVLENLVEITETEEICGGNQGIVVKRADDGNSETVADASVFVIGCDGSAHVFPNEMTYKTWWSDFENLSFVEDSFLATHALGDNVTIRPGTYLVKKISESKVYAIEPGGVLRWIPDEATAIALFGSNWNKIIVDVSDELFADYSIGENLTSEAYPDEVIGYLPEGRVVYLSGTSYFNLPGDTMTTMRLRSEFFVPLSAEIMAVYTDGGDLIYDETMVFPF